jgi:DNA-binding phage protein
MYLEDDEAIAAYVSEALLTGDPETIARALAGAVKARGRLRDGGNRY